MQRGDRVPELDGIRGLAILLVVYWHYVAMPFATSHGPGRWLFRAGMYSWSGVDLFFTLSGFLIGGILVDVRDTPHYFRTFYVRRAFRILPIYLIVCAAGFALTGVVPSLLPVLGRPMPAWTYATFTQNLWLLWQPWDVYLAATWSLAVEEQFYLTLPLIIRAVSPSRLRTTAVVLAIASMTLRSIFTLTVGPGGHVLMPCRADGLMLGVGAALVVRDAGLRQRLAAAPAPLHIAIAVFGGGLALYLWRGWSAHALPVATAGYSLLALFYVSLLLLAVCRPAGAWARLMRLAPLRRMGKLAYCLYLVNEPVLALTRFALRGAGFAPGLAADATAAAIAFVVSVALSEVSWRVFESKLVAIGHRFSYRDRDPRATVAPSISARSPGL